jgi:hypothetical protein
MKAVNRMGWLLSLAGALLLTATTSWAGFGERTDVLSSDGESFTNAGIDDDGNFVFDNAYGVYNYNSYNYGYIYRTVTTPGGNASVYAAFAVDEPDLVERESGKSKLKSSDQLFVEDVTLYSPAGLGTVANAADSFNLPGCKGKIKLQGPPAPYSPTDTSSAATGVTTVKCTEPAMAALFPDGTVRARVQELLGTLDDGTGLKFKGAGLVDTDL